jgi:hypothetical protein
MELTDEKFPVLKSRLGKVYRNSVTTKLIIVEDL